MRRIVLFAVPLLAVLALLPAGADARWRGHCIAQPHSPRCYFWTGHVKFVADGDTMDVDIRGDGTHHPRRIRLTGINAMEMTRYSRYPSRRRGQCHSLQATARLEQLVNRSHRNVRLAAQRRSSRSGARLRRQISVKIGGRWIDTGSTLVSEGHALWLPNGDEWAWNRRYSLDAQDAAGRRLRLWNTAFCHSGPQQATPVWLHVHWNAGGNDRRHPNGEWARIHNDGNSALGIGHWWFRDSSHRRYFFPRHTVVRAHGYVTLHMGRGKHRRRSYYWGLRYPAFENASYNRHWEGDGGYLYDPNGDMRAWQMYPRQTVGASSRR